MKRIALKRTLAIISAFSLFCSFFALDFTAVADGAEKFQNLVLNGDFEVGLNHWTPQSGGTPAILEDNGNHVAEFEWVAARKVIGQTMEVKPNTKYIFSYKYKKFNPPSNDCPDAYVALLDRNNAVIDQRWLNFAAAGQWNTFTYAFNSGANDKVTIKIADQNQNTPGKAYFDDISLCESLDISATTNGGGSVMGVDAKKVINKGDTVKLVANPAEKYSFAGWYNGSAKVSDSAEYSFTAETNAVYTAKFNLNRETPNLITNGDFENDANGWEVIAGSLPEVAYDEGVKSNIALFDKYVDGSNRNVVCQKFAVEKNTDYIVSFDFKKKNTKDQVDAFISVLASDKSTSVNDWYLNYRDNDKWYNTTNIINSGNNTTLFFRIADRSGGGAYIDNVQIYKKINVTVQSSNEVFGKVTGNGDWGFGFAKTLTAAADGGEFVGWYQGEQLISNEAQHSFTFFEDCAITAKFVAKKGDVNGDGKINAEDIALMRRALLNMDNSVQYDVNGDRLINVCDLVKMKNLSIEA